MGIIENSFDYEGESGHEIVFVFEAGFEDAALYEQQEFVVVERGVRSSAFWKPLKELCSRARPRYPAGLLDLLSNGAGQYRVQPACSARG